MASVTMQFSFPARFTPRKKWVVASCPVLDVHTQGPTTDAARANLIDALASFLISCFERGTLDAVLREAGFVPTHVALPVAAAARGHETVTVPLPFVIDASKAAERHAHPRA